MITIKRPTLRHLPSTSDNEIYAIGLVTHIWATLEGAINIWAELSTGTNMTRSKGQRASFRERVRAIREATNAQGVEPGKSEMIAMLDAAMEAQAERDKIVHWQFSKNADGDGALIGWMDKKRGLWRVNYKRIVKSAEKIDATLSRSYQLIFKYGKCSSNEAFRQSIAWQRICGIQHPKE